MKVPQIPNGVMHNGKEITTPLGVPRNAIKVGEKIKLKPNGKSRKRKADYWDDKQTEKTVYVLEIEHDSECNKAALAVMFEGGAQGNIKQIKVIHHGS